MSDLLLDTHAFLWFVWDDPQLSSHAKSAIENPENRKLISIAACWEIAIKCALGKLKLDDTAENFLAREIASNNFELLPVSLIHATRTEKLPFHHHDPFDRMLIVQAMTEDLTLITRDDHFSQYPIRTLW